MSPILEGIFASAISTRCFCIPAPVSGGQVAKSYLLVSRFKDSVKALSQDGHTTRLYTVMLHYVAVPHAETLAGRMPVEISLDCHIPVAHGLVIDAPGAFEARRGAACPAAAEACNTTSIRAVNIDSRLTMLDSPDIVFPSSSSPSTLSGGLVLPKNAAEAYADLVLLNTVLPKQMDDPVPVVALLLRRLATSPTQKLQDAYGLAPLLPARGPAWPTGRRSSPNGPRSSSWRVFGAMRAPGRMPTPWSSDTLGVVPTD
jgi:hypothetical protein